jgi:ABC-type antimicrobial peptide transport system permease subunit
LQLTSGCWSLLNPSARAYLNNVRRHDARTIVAALGLAGALLTARFLRTLLFGVSGKDPLIYAVVILGVACVGLAANFIPARRAASVDPMRALRSE